MPTGVYIHKPCKEETKKLISERVKGKKRTLEQRERMSKSHIGIVYSIERNRKISIAHKGKIPKNLDGIHKRRKGTKFPEEWCKHMSESHKIACNTPEFIAMRRYHRSKQVIPRKDTSIEKTVQENLSKRGFIKGKDYITHYSFSLGTYYHQADIYMPEFDLVIEDDGTYWHSSLESKQKDFEIDRDLFDQGINVLRLTEAEIESGTYTNVLNMVIGVKCT